jgi:putative glutamine amidotransferase
MRTINQPIIGIVPSFDEGAVISGGHDGIKRVFIRRDYMKAIASVGATPLILSPDMPMEHITALCDGIVISGGYDIDPMRYNEQPLPEVRQLEPAERFDWEATLIDACDETNRPILGICYGLQRLNVHYGGSLIQDISTEIGTHVKHDNIEHEVTFQKTFLGVSPGQTRMVASRHHQAIGRLGNNVIECASTHDGIVEAAIINDRHFGIQWHAESDITGIHMYRAFVEHCQTVLS